jgi:hypothetical protein
MTILNIYSARPILPALFAARYLSWEACPHQPVARRGTTGRAVLAVGLVIYIKKTRLEH